MNDATRNIKERNNFARRSGRFGSLCFPNKIGQPGLSRFFMVSPSCSVKLDWVDGGWLLLFTQGIYAWTNGNAYMIRWALHVMMVDAGKWCGKVAVQEGLPASEGLKEDWDSTWVVLRCMCAHFLLLDKRMCGVWESNFTEYDKKTLRKSKGTTVEYEADVIASGLTLAGDGGMGRQTCRSCWTGGLLFVVVVGVWHLEQNGPCCYM